jgi:TrmH family RNA methyltransferase
MNSDLITSTANPRIKAIRKLRERKERQQTGLYYVEGLRIVAEALQLNADIETLVVSPALLESSFASDLVKDWQNKRLPILDVSPEVFTSFSLKEGPQGIGAVIRQRWLSLNQITLAPGSLWIALDAVADPGNLGAILRTGDAVGAAGVILLDHSTDPYDPTAVRASMGALFSQQIVKVSLMEFVLWKKECGCQVVGTSGAAPIDYHHLDYPDPCVLLMGSERQGLQPHLLEYCDWLVSIPMIGRSDSLNLAVATAVVLYEIFNQRRERRK